MSTEEEFLAAQTKDQEKISAVEDVMKEINLFKLHDIDEVQISSQDIVGNTTKEDSSKKETGTLDKILPKSIIFFYKNKSQSKFSFENLEWPLRHSKLTNIEDIKNGKMKRLLKGYLYKEREKLLSYFFKLMFTTDDEELLKCIKNILLEIIDSVENLIFKPVIAVFFDGLLNLGAQILEESQSNNVADNSSDDLENTLNNNEKLSDNKLDLKITLKQVFQLMRHILRIENAIKDNYSFPMDDLIKLLLVFIYIAQDPIIILSTVTVDILHCIRIILEFLPAEDKEFRGTVTNIADKISIYWDEKLGVENFPHNNAAFICYELLPNTSRGSKLKVCLSYCSIMTILDCEDIHLITDVTITKIYNLLRDNLEKVRSLSTFALYSLYLLIHCCLTEVPKEERVLKNLVELMSNLSSFNDSGESSEMVGHTRVKYLTNVVCSKWNCYMNENKDQSIVSQLDITSSTLDFMDFSFLNDF